MYVKIKYLLLIVLFVSFTNYSQELIQNKTETTITFKIKNFGFNVDGNFKDFNITSNFNSGNLEENFLNAEISVNSIFTNSKSRDGHLLEADYFDAIKYPKIIFKSIEIKKIDNSIYSIEGFITIKGFKKKIKTQLEIKETNLGVVMRVNFVLNRKEFRVGGSSFVLSKNVNIKMKYVANRN